MKKTQNRLFERASVIAVRAALASFVLIPAVYAADPSGTIEAGVLNVDKNSAKFGEYNGLNKKGGYAIGNFEVRGGGTYDDGDPARWRINGTNLGLDTRNLQGEFGSQGDYRINFGYDEIVKNYSDAYQTIFNGGGTTSLTLPANWPAAATRTATTANTSWNNTQTPAASAAINAALHPFDAGTKRKTVDVGLSKLFGSDWAFSVTARRQDKEGSRLMGVNMNRFSGLNSIVPAPVDHSTDQVEANARYASGKMYFNVGYYGSFFKNNIGLWTVDYPGAAATTPLLGNQAHMSGEPDNQMHQLNLTGGYNFSQVTKLVVQGSYARLTQNEAFSYVATNWTVPESSANARVNTSQFMARLTTRPMPKLGLNATYKYDNRENKTPVHDFLTNADISTAAAAPNQFTNEPNNRRQHQVNLDADYSLGRGEAVLAGYEWQQIQRTGQTYSETPFKAKTTTENTVKAEYRNSLAEAVTGRLAYAHAQRRSSEYEENVLVPVQEAPSPPLPAADPTLPGFRQFWLADRNRDKLRSSVAYQASQSVNVQAGLDYNKDRFTNSPYGLKDSNSWVLNLDGTYAATETFSLNAYYTYEDMKSQTDSRAVLRTVNNSLNGGLAPVFFPHAACASYTNATNQYPNDILSDPCRAWSQSQSDKVHTIGAGFVSRGLFLAKLDVTGSLAYSRATTAMPVSGGNYLAVTSVANTATANQFFAATPLPDVTSTMTDLRFTGTYHVDKQSSVRLTYWGRRLKANDWQYDAYTNSSLGVSAVQNYVGPMMTAPNYTVHVLGASYLYRF